MADAWWQGDWRTNELHGFLDDGDADGRSPAFVFVGDDDSTLGRVQLLHSEGLPDVVAPSRGGLKAFDAAASPPWSPVQVDRLCALLQQDGSWLVIRQAERLLESADGRRMYAGLCERIAGNAFPALALTVTRSAFPQFAEQTPRLSGLSYLFDFEEQSRSRTPVHYVISTGGNRDDTGWAVRVRIRLARPRLDQLDASVEPVAGDRAIRQVEKFMLLGDESYPTGAQISFWANSFSASQFNAAFNAAEVATRRAMGRHLHSGEVIEATRGVGWF